MPQIEFIRVNNDVNGNPRYVCHFHNLLTEREKESGIGIMHGYTIACKRANKLGGRKFHNRQYGGGIVFQSYSLPELSKRISEKLAEDSIGQFIAQCC